MADMLIRDLPDEVLAVINRRAAALAICNGVGALWGGLPTRIGL